MYMARHKTKYGGLLYIYSLLYKTDRHRPLYLNPAQDIFDNLCLYIDALRYAQKTRLLSSSRIVSP